MVPQIVKERPLIFWSGLLGLLAIIGVLAPVDWTVGGGEGGLFGRTRPLNAFSERVVDIDESLQKGRQVTVDDKRVFDIHLFVASRRLVRAGDMSHDNMKRAQEMLREMHLQLRREQTSAARNSVRNMWLDRLVDEIPRLDRQKVGEELERLHRQLDTHLKTSN